MVKGKGMPLEENTWTNRQLLWFAAVLSATTRSAVLRGLFWPRAFVMISELSKSYRNRPQAPSLNNSSDSSLLAFFLLTLYYFTGNNSCCTWHDSWAKKASAHVSPLCRWGSRFYIISNVHNYRISSNTSLRTSFKSFVPTFSTKLRSYRPAGVLTINIWGW